jgi:hypothetical protein
MNKPSLGEAFGEAARIVLPPGAIFLVFILLGGVNWLSGTDANNSAFVLITVGMAAVLLLMGTLAVYTRPSTPRSAEAFPSEEVLLLLAEARDELAEFVGDYRDHSACAVISRIDETLVRFREAD